MTSGRLESSIFDLENVLDFLGGRAYGDEFALGWRSSGVEQLICNQPVGGSNPFASFNCTASHPCLRTTRLTSRALRAQQILGEVPERPKGADCKSAGVGLRRFESSPPHWVYGTVGGETIANGHERFGPNVAS